MLDLATLRSGETGSVLDSLQRRGMDPQLLPDALERDREWRNLLQQAEDAQAQLNNLHRQVGKLKKARKEEEAAALIARATAEAEREASLRPRVTAAKAAADEALRRLPNKLHARVPPGATDAQNAIERQWGLDRIGTTVARDAARAAAAGAPPPRAHDDLLYRVGGYEPLAGRLVGGRRAYFLTGVGAELNEALLRLATQFLRRRDPRACGWLGGGAWWQRQQARRRRRRREPSRGPEAGLEAAAAEGGAVEHSINDASAAATDSGPPASRFVRVSPPLLMKAGPMGCVAQLREYDEALYRVGGAAPAPSKSGGTAEGSVGFEHEHQYLIATAEQPLCCLHMGQELCASTLPRRYAGASVCFRKEAGSRRDTRGIFRVHQFEKVEQFVLVAPPPTASDDDDDDEVEVRAAVARGGGGKCDTPPSAPPIAGRSVAPQDTDSDTVLEEMVQTSEAFLQLLGLPYRVVRVCAGQLSPAAHLKYDIEAWFPAGGMGSAEGAEDIGEAEAKGKAGAESTTEGMEGDVDLDSGGGAMRELVSASNCTDYQARAVGVRFVNDFDNDSDDGGTAKTAKKGKKPEKNKKKKKKKRQRKKFVHMLNATLCATTRTLCCILECYQTPDGVRVPDALVPLMDGVTFLPFVRGGPPEGV
eukprot:g3477.t1